MSSVGEGEEEEVEGVEVEEAEAAAAEAAKEARAATAAGRREGAAFFCLSVLFLERDFSEIAPPVLCERARKKRKYEKRKKRRRGVERVFGGGSRSRKKKREFFSLSSFLLLFFQKMALSTHALCEFQCTNRQSGRSVLSSFDRKRQGAKREKEKVPTTHRKGEHSPSPSSPSPSSPSRRTKKTKERHSFSSSASLPRS